VARVGVHLGPLYASTRVGGGRRSGGALATLITAVFMLLGFAVLLSLYFCRGLWWLCRWLCVEIRDLARANAAHKAAVAADGEMRRSHLEHQSAVQVELLSGEGSDESHAS